MWSPEVSLVEPWGSVRSTLRTYDLNNQLQSLIPEYNKTSFSIAEAQRLHFSL